MNGCNPTISVESTSDQKQSGIPTGPPKLRFKVTAQSTEPAAAHRIAQNQAGEKRSHQQLLEAAEAGVCSVIDQDSKPAFFQGITAHVGAKPSDTKNPRQARHALYCKPSEFGMHHFCVCLTSIQ
jgi:hypothetical protein